MLIFKSIFMLLLQRAKRAAVNQRGEREAPSLFVYNTKCIHNIYIKINRLSVCCDK